MLGNLAGEGFAEMRGVGSDAKLRDFFASITNELRISTTGEETDYSEGQHKMLLVYFCSEGPCLRERNGLYLESR